MIVAKGYISEDGFWKIEARLHFDSKEYPNKIEFLIDSGSGSTILSPHTADELGIAFDDLKYYNKLQLMGPTGCMGRQLPGANLIFNTKSVNILELCPRMYMADPQKWESDYNLIGQDILKSFNVVSNNKTKIVMLILSRDKYEFLNKYKY